MVASEAERQWKSSATTLPWRDLANRFGTLLDARVTLILPDGTVEGESSQPPESLENHLSRPEVEHALRGEEDLQVRYSTTLGQEMLFSAVPIRYDNQIIGVARLAVTLADINASVNTISSTILAGTVVTILVTIILAILLTNYTTRPLRQLTQRAVQLSGIPAIANPIRKSKDEVTQLENAFDQLASQIDIQNEEISAEREKLEAVLSSMADGVIIVDPQGSIQLVNHAATRIFNLQDTQSAVGHTLIEGVRHHQLVELWRKYSKDGTAANRHIRDQPRSPVHPMHRVTTHPGPARQYPDHFSRPDPHAPPRDDPARFRQQCIA